jgi:uncharacterized protein YrrD
MLRRTHEMKGYTIGAADGPIGAIHDFLFDDHSWLVRWLVVDTGHVLPGRKVLLPPSILGQVNHVGRQVSVRLTKDEVKDSPGIDTDAPVSRRMEADTYNYYNWTPYWNTGFYYGGFGYAGDLGAEPSVTRAARRHEHEEMAKGDRRLRSAHEVSGYEIAASDGHIGRVVDLLIADGDWSVRYLVVDTEEWWGGHKVLISPRSVDSIDWMERAVTLYVDRATVKNSPAYDGQTTVDRLYENQFHDYYDDAPARSHEPA